MTRPRHANTCDSLAYCFAVLIKADNAYLALYHKLIGLDMPIHCKSCQDEMTSDHPPPPPLPRSLHEPSLKPYAQPWRVFGQYIKGLSPGLAFCHNQKHVCTSTKPKHWRSTRSWRQQRTGRLRRQGFVDPGPVLVIHTDYVPRSRCY